VGTLRIVVQQVPVAQCSYSRSCQLRLHTFILTCVVLHKFHLIPSAES